ncbi:MAG: HEAT repeat domain-containing protein [Pirellulaceae bacterium]
MLTAANAGRFFASEQPAASLWGLCTFGSPSALAAIGEQLNGNDDSLAQLPAMPYPYRYAPAKAPLEQLLGHANLQVRRAAAEGLGRIGDNQSARMLFASLDASEANDRHWQHSVTYALIELFSAIDEAARECLSIEALQVGSQSQPSQLHPARHQSPTHCANKSLCSSSINWAAAEH